MTTQPDDSEAKRSLENDMIKQEIKGFLPQLIRGLLRDLFFIIVVFAVATGASAIACWYYDLPLLLSLLGGILALGISLALKTDSIFD